MARGRPDGDAARRARPGEPRQPARGGQEREAPELRQPALRLVLREADGRGLPGRPPVPPHADRLDGGPRRGQRSRTSIAFFRTWYAPNNAVLSIVGDVDEEAALRRRRALLRADPGQPGIVRPLDADGRRPTSSAARSREVVPDDVPLVRVHFGFRCPPYGTRRVRRARGRRRRSWPAAGQPAVPARSCASSAIAQDVAAFALPLVAGGIDLRRLGHRRGRRATPRRASAPSSSELERLADEPVTRRRAGARARADRGGELGALSRVSRRSPTGCRMFAALLRPAGADQRAAAALPRRRPPSRSAPSRAQVFRADNRVVLTYVPGRAAARRRSRTRRHDRRARRRRSRRREARREAGFMTDRSAVDTGVAELPDEPTSATVIRARPVASSTRGRRPASRASTTSQRSSASAWPTG